MGQDQEGTGLTTPKNSVVLVDVSRSMSVAVSPAFGISRLDVVLGMISWFDKIDTVVAFDSVVRVVDMGSLSIGDGLSEIGLALEHAAKADAILLFTDGHESNADRRKSSMEVVLQTRIPPIYAFGIGVDANMKLLEHLATVTGGNFMHFSVPE